MAAIYDQQGNYVGDDGAPSLDQMKLELVKKNQPLASQIPGYDRPVPPAQTKPDPLGAAAGNFTSLATNFNPFMMAKSMQETAGLFTVPAVAALKGVGESITTSPSGTYTSGQAPKYAEQVAKQFMEANAPQTPMTQEFAGAIAPYMADLPAYLGHLSTGRPAFTPNDLRVMGAEATRVGRQVRDIPTDFANAQSGLQKLDPITGQPAMGSKLQGVAESVGDIMAQREMQGLPPIPGLPASMQPMNPKMYAMRPEGSRLASAVIPETSKANPYFAVTKELVRDVVGDGSITPLQTLEDIQNRYLRQPDAEGARDAFFNFLQKKAIEMYPDAPSPGEALGAYKARFSNKEASAPHTLRMYNEFLQTPEGSALAARVDLPTAEEITARHEAAVNWLNSQFTNYINEKVGTPNEPGIKLAGQGLTYAPRGNVMASAHTTDFELQRRREQAGMPAKTATDQALAAANTQLQTLQQQAIDALTAKREQTQAAIDAGYGVPGGPNLGQFEPFAQASRAADKATIALNKQRKLVDNLQLGAAYENAIDTAIKVTPAGKLLEKLPYEERQFYPALLRTPATDNAYTASERQLKNLGFDDMARNFYDDVMSGKIPLDKVSKLTVEKYIRSVAEPRVAKEKAEQAAQANYKNAVDAQFKASADAHIPNDKVFGNVGALEITNRFTPEEVTKLVSEITTALDVCIGEGGIRRDIPNLWHPGTGNRQYVPIYNVATGERNPDAPSPRMTYINAVRDGSQIADFRDISTGEPVAVFDFNPSSIPGKYNINFASGHANGKVNPIYIDGIKAYLNSRADSIHDVGTNLYNHTGISDSMRTENRTLAGMIDMPISEFARYDLSNLPRFITHADLRNYIANLKANEPAAQTPAIASQRPSESIEAYTSGAVSSAIDNTLDAQRRQLLDAGEGNYIPTAEAFFEDIRGYFNQYLDSQGPARALELTTNRLLDLEPEYANSNRIGANIISDGIVELMHTLGLQAEYVQNRMAAEATGQRPDYLRMTHDAALDLDRARGEEAGNDLRAVFRAITETLGVDPAQNTDRFIHELRIAASAAPRDSVGVVLNELADQMESAYMRDWEPEVAPAAPATQSFEVGDFNRFVNNLADTVPAPTARDVQHIGKMIATEMGFTRTNFLGNTEADIAAALREQPAAFATRLNEAAELEPNTITELALRRMANEIVASLPQPNPAQQAAPAFGDAEFDNFVADIRANVDAQVAHDIVRISNTVADGMGTNIRGALSLRPALFAERLADQAELAENFMLEQALNDLALQIAPEAPPAAQQPPTEEAAAMQWMQTQPRGELVNHIEPGRWDAINRTVDSLQQLLFGQRQVDPDAVVADIREGRMPQFTNGFSFFEREIIARDINDYLELNNPRGREAGLEPIRDPEAYRTAAEDILTVLEENYYTDMPSPQDAIRLVRQHLRALRRNGEMAFENIMGDAAAAYEWSPELLNALEVELESLIERYQDMGAPDDNPPTRRGPFRSAGSAAVRGMPLGNLNIRPAINVAALRGPDTQPVRNFIQQVGNLPGVTQEGLRTGLMAFEQMDPARQITKAEFVRELLPSSYDIVDLKGASQDNQHLMDAAEIAIEEDPEYVGQLLGLEGKQLTAWAKALRDHYNDYDSFPAPVKRALAKQGLEDGDEYAEAYDVAYHDALETYAAENGDNLIDEEGYTYSETQRLVQPSMGDEYGEFGVTHPDQHGTYHHFDLAPQGVIGHFRGTYNSADPLTLTYWDQQGNLQAFETPHNSYAIEEIQSDAQKTTQQTGHLHQVHGVLFKAAIQKALELGANTVYLPTANTIAHIRHSQPKRFTPIYDQAIVKEGLKPLLKIPGVTARMTNGYHEISFTPEAIEYILNGPGQTLPGYQKGGSVKKPDVPTPWLFSVPTYSETVAYEMYPGQKGQDDQRDAARHMLAAGTLSRKYGPGVAEFLGKAHEFTTSPLQAVKTLFGGQMPPDYAMDTHNNTVGAQLGQRAKSQAELEDLVQAEAERASRTQTPGQAFIKRANGGIVQQNPSLDAMKYALMLRKDK